MDHSMNLISAQIAFVVSHSPVLPAIYDENGLSPCSVPVLNFHPLLPSHAVGLVEVY